jgi:hypothetical protein
MSNKIGLVLPVMRPSYADAVIADLVEQTTPPDYVILVDNGGTWPTCDKGFLVDSKTAKFHMRCYRPWQGNIGTNAVWNLMWQDKFDGFDYVGVIGDDYRMNQYCLENMKKLIDTNITPAATCRIEKGAYKPIANGPLRWEPVQGKGNLGFALFRRDFLLTLPPIPKNFFIFFGDNWIGWHIEKKHQHLMRINTPISHEHKTDLGEKLNYREVIESERIIWKKFVRGEIELR